MFMVNVISALLFVCLDKFTLGANLKSEVNTPNFFQNFSKKMTQETSYFIGDS